MISLVENQGFIAEDYATRIAKLFKNNEIVGGGLATSNAASRLIKGISWRESGEPSPYAGNGTAMRVAPLGLFYYNDLELLEKYAIEQGKITHKDMRCSAGSVIVALSVSYVLTHDTFDNYDLLDFLEQKIKPISELFSRELANLKNWIELPFDQAITRISQSGKPEMTSTFWNKISPYVIPTVLCSLYSFLCNKDNFMNTIATSIKVGGDVDTTSAISGAVSGAFLGIDAIPKIYSEIVIDQGKWGYSQLMSLAEQLYSKIN
jgi:ADP-ribosylglycohydrolase